MFKRKVYNDLLQWKDDSQGKTALLVEGARRVGKSTVAITIRSGPSRKKISYHF